MTKQTLPNDKPIVCEIVEKWKECFETYSYKLQLSVKVSSAKPGQFVMLWVPGVDEYPIGIAGFKDGLLEIGIAKMGPGTEAMHQKDIGDFVGIRGFYGKPFAPPENVNHLLIGGGFGMTPLKLLTTTLMERANKQEIHVFEGARSKDRLMYLNWLQELHDQGEITFHVCTDDGSYGYQGFPTVALEEFLKTSESPSVIYAAGPERMMKVIFELGKRYPKVIDMQMSLADRYMRCGFGACSYCTVDPTGWRICVDGPIFNKEQLEKISDFGVFKRLDTGEKERI
jgi:dihydroorotate dehydrogenase electron transfer subunit